MKGTGHQQVTWPYKVGKVLLRSRFVRWLLRRDVAWHRARVGGKWEEIGRLQFEFLRARGLQPQHVLLDIGCGSLRGGVHFIRYLDPGNYLGIDVEGSLIEAGLRHELPPDVREAKRPELNVSGEFEFEQFTKRPDFALAQSVFTHLPPDKIRQCLRNLRDHCSKACHFYATYLDAEKGKIAVSSVQYTREEMRQFGEETGWHFTYLGDWGHPREQLMALYTPS